MVAVVLLCVLAIVVLYIRNIRYARQGNFWHAVSQLMCDGTQPVLEQSNELNDSSVTRAVKERNVMVSVGRSTLTGRVEIVWPRGGKETNAGR